MTNIPQSIVLEWLNGYLFFLDLCALGALGFYLAAMIGRQTLGARLAMGLSCYLTGHTINRFEQWRWWDGARDYGGLWAEASHVLREGPSLAATMLVTLGLMCMLRVLLDSYFGAKVWVSCLVFSMAMPALVIYLRM